MKFTIRLTDVKGTPIPNAKIEVEIPRKGQDPFVITPPATDAKAATAFDIGEDILRTADFKAATYTVFHGTTRFSAQLAGRDRSEKDGLTLKLQALKYVLTDAPTPQPNRKVGVIISLKDEKNFALGRADVRIIYRGETEITLQTDRSGNGRIEVNHRELEIFADPEFLIHAKTAEAAFVSQSFTGLAQEGKDFKAVWVMAPTNIVVVLPDPDIDTTDGDLHDEQSVPDAGPAPRMHRVSGRVVDASGKPMAAAIVAAVHAEIGFEKSLGDVKTDKQGRYKIEYALHLLPDGRDAADLIVRVLDNAKAVLAASPVIAQAKPVEVVNFAVGEGAWTAPTLYEQIGQALSDQLEKVDFAALTDQDGDLLAKRSKLKVHDVTAFIAAWRLALAVGAKPAQTLAAAPFFAWIMGDVATTLRALAAIPDTVLANAIRRAEGKLWIPDIDETRIITALRKAEPSASDDDLSVIRALLRLAKIDEKHAPAVAQAIATIAQETPRWAAIAKIVTKKPAAVLSDIVDVWTQLDRNIAVTTAVVTKNDITTALGLAKLPEARIATLLEDTGTIPETANGDTLRERRDSHAAALARGIETRFPYDTYTAQLPTFGGKAADMGKWLASRPKVRFDTPPAQNEGSDIADARSLYRVGPAFRRAATVTTLLAGGITRAAQIVAMGRPAFRRDFAEPLFGVPQADAVYDRAAALMGAQNAGEVATATRGRPADGVIPTDLRGQLFGQTVMSGCSHCGSILSPGAYLVDLFAFAQLAALPNGSENGRQRLAKRRPDLEQTHVTCANTDTVLPYIDLVLEVLEDNVAPWTGPARQTTLAYDALKAWPEYTNGAAYETISTPAFPWTLPFNRAFAVTQAMLDATGMALWDIRTMCRTPAAPAGLGVADPQHITMAKNSTELARKFAQPNMKELRKHYTSFAQFAQLLQFDITDIVDLFDTDFVSAGAPLPFDAEGGATVAQLDDSMLNRLQLLGRLHRHTGLSISDLDHMLAICGAPKGASADDWWPQMAACVALVDNTGLQARKLRETMALPAPARDAVLANMLRLNADEFAQLQNLSGIDPGNITSIATAQAQCDAMAKAGLTARDVLAWAQVPPAGALFSPEASEVARETVIAAIKALAQTDDATAPTDPLMGWRQVAAETLAAALSVDAGLIGDHLGHANDALLKRFLVTAGVIADTQNPIDAATLARLWKGWSVQEAMEMTAADAFTLAALRDDIRLADPMALPVTAGDRVPTWAGLVALVAHQTLNLKGMPADQSLFDALTSLNPDTAPDPDQLAALMGWSPDETGFVLDQAGFTLGNSAAFLRAHAILDLAQVMKTAKTLQTDVKGIFSLVKADEAELARDIAAQSFDAQAWPDAAQDAMAPVREGARDALTAFILHRDPRLKNAHMLYENLLIDTQMSACYETSRIKQAAASVQQFVARVNLGLEGQLAYSESQAAEWAWRRNYRVWEANRKVFLYPENWTVPELRDNKTELYETLEATLLQGDVRNDTAEVALMDYARGLHTISSLEMVGLVEDTDTQTTYIFARTHETPHAYYWCERPQNGLWTGWRRVELEIEGNHFLPVIYNRRLFVFWANIEEKINQTHPDYVAAIATAEAAMEDSKSRLNNALRTIDDLEAKLAEAQNKVDNSQDPFGMYAIMKTIYTDSLGRARTTLDTVQLEIIQHKIDIAELNKAYTHFDIHLTWSQYHRLTGWSAPRRSRDSVKTLLSDASWHWSDLNHVFLRRHVYWKTLRIDVMSDRNSDTTEGDVSYAHGYTYGSFTFDLVNEALIVTQKTFNSLTGVPTIAPRFLRRGQTFQAPRSSPELALSADSTAAATVLLQSINGVKEGRLVPAARAFDSPGEAPVLFSKFRHNFLIEARAVDRPAIISRNPDSDAAPVSTPPAQKATSVTKSGDGYFVNAVKDSAKDVVAPVQSSVVSRLSLAPKWHFSDLSHPYTETIIMALYQGGPQVLYQPDAAGGNSVEVALDRQSKTTDFFDGMFRPTDQVDPAYPVDNFTFDRRDPFAVYNWELFFHAPLAIALTLSRNRNFETAQEWFHYIFNPIGKDGPNNASAWRFGPFKKLHHLLEQGNYDDLASLDEQALDMQVDEWLANPFNPHAIARMRSLAYMRTTFMAYLDNLIDWADDLFARDTMESINEATQLYVLVAQLLGNRPVTLPELPTGVVQSVADMLDGKAGHLTAHAPTGSHNADNGTHPPTTPFFQVFGQMCVPANDRLLDYWDRVEDRLFKIRHCMNIDGIVRQLPLFLPPIDPALLVRAAAAGVSISSAVSSLSAPRPHYRFTYMNAKALEFTADVKALGSALLSALEKKDSEELAQLKANHQEVINKRVRDIHKIRVTEAETAVDGATDSLARAAYDREYYAGLIDQRQLPSEEKEESALKNAHRWRVAAQAASSVSGVLHALPQLGVSGIAPTINIGGLHLGAVARTVADVANFVSDQHAYDARKHARNAADDRRLQGWEHQLRMSTRSAERAEKDLIGAELRLAIAQNELANQEKQIAHDEAQARFLTDKFSSQALYGWMSGVLSRLYYQSYQLAVDMARRAEACYRDERDDPNASFITFGHWESMHKGLLAGEKLILDLRTMEAAYLANNARKQEMRKTVSLARLDPKALMDLRQGQPADFVLPELIFDLDAPGQFNRKIKSVSLSIAALAGPQVAIACELTLLDTYLRKAAYTDDDPADLTRRTGQEVITTSAAQNDAGLFQVDFRDERYLPFEGAGAISRWQLRLPDKGMAQFNYGTISDVMVTVSYTADVGPEPSRNAIQALCMAQIASVPDVFGTALQPAQLLSLRYDFPMAWAQIRNADAAEITLDLRQDRFSYLFNGRMIILQNLTCIGSDGSQTTTEVNQSAGESVVINLTPAMTGQVQAETEDVTLLIAFDVG